MAYSGAVPALRLLACAAALGAAGLGLGYRELFRPACNVHDFAYRNLGREAHTPENRLRSDAALLRNLQTICGSLARAQRPGCLAAASAYVRAVRWRGAEHF